MGNAGSASRDRHKAGNEPAPPSPSKEGQAFTFDKKPNNKPGIATQEEDEPFFAKDTQVLFTYYYYF